MKRRAEPTRYLTVNEVCAIFGFGRSKFYEMLRTTDLEAIVVRVPPPRGPLRIPLQAFENWLNGRR